VNRRGMFTSFKLTVLPALGYAAIRLLARTLRLRWLHDERVEEFWASGRHFIIAFWHGRQLMMPLVYKGPGVHALISEHRDGELIHRIIRRFGLQSVRGSTTRGGVRALRELVRLGRSGTDLAVTPDGPRGPRCIAQLGTVELAKLTGLPIMPVTFAASKKNSSGAGISLKCRVPSVGHVFCGASPSRSRGPRPGLISRRSGWNWNRH